MVAPVLPGMETDTLVVGAGQAGVSMSEHLGRLGVPHLVLERDRIAERWRTERWDSLVANGPAWHDRFPGLGRRAGWRRRPATTAARLRSWTATTTAR